MNKKCLHIKNFKKLAKLFIFCFIKIAMNIHNNYPVNFGAIYINSGKIGKLNTYNGTYENQKNVSFVELTPENSNDLEALSNLCWENEGYEINTYATLKGLQEGKLDKNRYKVYALTLQKDNFEKLNSDDILGVTDGMTLTSKNDIHLSYLQVNPEYIHTYKPLYKGIGSTIINSLKEKCQQISLISSDEEYVKNFYIKNGFKQMMCTNLFVWEKEK